MGKMMMAKGWRLWLILSGAAFLFSPPCGAVQLNGTLSADRETVRPGETVTLLLKVSGGEESKSYQIEQPDLPDLKQFTLLSVSQRNETDISGGKERFSVSFLYRLGAGEAGAEKIPGIEVRYREKGESESRVLSVSGIELIVKEAGWGRGRTILLVLLSAGIVAVLIALYRKKGQVGPGEAPAAPGEVGRGKSGAAVRALARLEEASRLKLEGDSGGYCGGILEALSEYLKEDRDREIDDIARRLNKLCERAKYASDRASEHEVEELGRRAEIFFKKRIREELR